MPTLELFFDCGSPWTYLAFHAVDELVAETGVTLVHRPILVGGVFNAVNPGVYEQRASATESKWRHHMKDLQDWSRLHGLTIRWPEVFPVNSVKVMRGCLAADEEGKLVAFARAAFEAYWRDGLDVSQDDALAKIAADAGCDAARIAARIRDDEIKQRLRDNTDELCARGGFGSPTFFLDGDDMYFGNDRIPLVRAAITRARA